VNVLMEQIDEGKAKWWEEEWSVSWTGRLDLLSHACVYYKVPIFNVIHKFFQRGYFLNLFKNA
jgi:hypothetical protein